MSSFHRCFLASAATFALGACAARQPIRQLGPAYPEGPAPELAKARPLESAASTPAPAAPSSAPPTQKPQPTSLPAFGNARFGGAGPLLLEATSNAGNWLSLCKQASAEAGRKGAFARFLVSPSEERPLESFLRASADGRYAVVQSGGAVSLWDASTHATVDLSALGADTRLSVETGAAVRTFDFDAASEHLLYVRTGEPGARVVIRTLADGSERELDPGAGQVWRASFDPGGTFVTVELVSTDTNHNGRLDLPVPLLKAPRPCGHDSAHFHAFEARGDRPEIALLPLAGGDAIREPELLMPLGDALLLRSDDGALSLARAGKKRALEPAECKARIVHADPVRELLIVGCAQKKKTGHVSLELVTREGRKSLDLEQAIVELDREVSGSPRLVPLYPGTDTVLFDADKRDVITLQAGDAVLAVEQTHALIRRGNALVLFDGSTRKETALTGEIDKFPQILRSSPYVFISPVLVNVATGAVVGSTRARPLALSGAGQLLFADSEPNGATLAQGPLHWSLLDVASP